MSIHSSRPVGAHPPLPGPKAHLCGPLPLLVDLDGGLVTGWTSSGDESLCNPERMMISRPGLDLIRLQRRFGGHVLLVCSALPEVAQWVASVLGLGTALIAVAAGRGAAGKARIAAERFDPHGFDIIGGVRSVAQVGALARRIWLIGQDAALQRQMLVDGGQAYMFDDADRMPLSRLMVARQEAASWTLERDRWPDEGHPAQGAGGVWRG